MKVFKSKQKIIYLEEFTQLLAFNFDNQVARYQYVKQANQDNIMQLVLTEKNNIIGLLLVDVSGKLNTIINAFVRKNVAKQEVFNTLSTYFQVNRWSGVVFKLVSSWDEHYLIQRGFYSHDNQFTKVYTYPKYFVFGGGGAHGAFQTGAFDVLKSAGIIPDGIIGVSVGAITGMSLMHLDSQTARQVWANLTTAKVYGVDEIGVTRSKFTKTMLNQLISRDFKSKKLLLDMFMPVATEALKKPKIKFTLVTTNAKTLTPKVVIVDEKMAPLELSKWVVASSAFFPVVAPIKIKGESYIDGGYSNDIPINEAIRQGAKDIYVIDIQGMGRSKRYRVPADVKIHWIKTKWDLGPMLDFMPDKSASNLKLGELEARKFLGELTGSRYFFSKRPMYKMFNWYNLKNVFATTEFTQKLLVLVNSPAIEYLLRNKVEKFSKQKIKADKMSGLILVEYLASILNVRYTECYDESSFTQALRNNSDFENLKRLFELPTDTWTRHYLYQHPEVILLGILYLILKWQKNENYTKIG